MLSKRKSAEQRTGFDLASKEKRLKKLEEQTLDPGFWQTPESAKEITKDINDLKNEIDFWKGVGLEIESLKKNIKESSVNGDLEEKLEEIKRRVDKEEIKIFLSGSYDKNNAIITIYSGVGGRDAEDWTKMLLRMYERYLADKKYEVAILDKHEGAEAGVKMVVCEVIGEYAYGYLKKEAGVHRLVRISPFSPNKLRHTSFALVEVLPQIEPQEFQIDEKDLKVEMFRSSGPGGQNVNKRETAVRIVHIPTGIAVACQSQRSQMQNKERALVILRAKLHNLSIQQQKQEIKGLRQKVSPEWGNQIRSYVLHPYQLVKDHRTGVEDTNIQKVLDGDLDKFVEAELKGLVEKFK